MNIFEASPEIPRDKHPLKKATSDCDPILGRSHFKVPRRTILETAPPVVLASEMALKEGNGKKPIYTIHKWWARRLGPVFRLLLLGATHSAGRSAWLKGGAFYDKHDLSGVRVFDPFVGGGTSLVEASKCGASVIGSDIDPVAAFVTEKELEPIDLNRLKIAYKQVEAAAKTECLRWYQTTLPDGRTGSIIYSFWVEEITSPDTGQVIFAHPHYQLHRDKKNRRQTAFCSNCHAIIELALRRVNFECLDCGHHTRILEGVVAKGRIDAPGFKAGQRLNELYSEAKPPRYRLFALQVLAEDTGKKSFKRADDDDRQLYEATVALWANIGTTDDIVPNEKIPTTHRTDHRPISYGLCHYRSLFNSRQLLCLSRIGHAIRAVQDDACREFLALAFSDCLASNNMLCYYAFDYDKLTPLFGLHAYSKVTRPVENNVWGVEMGRGAFSKCFAKMLRGKEYAVKPYESKHEDGKLIKVFTGESIAPELIRGTTVPAPSSPSSTRQTAQILNQSSQDVMQIASDSVHLVLTDPPYYNNLAYSELSDFYHVWLKRLHLPNYNGKHSDHAPMAESLYAGKKSGQGKSDPKVFAEGLASVFKDCHRVLVPNGIMVFTYSHNEIEAWSALAFSLASAGFMITNVFPVRSEGRSQFHSDIGNLKWDAVFCCRRRKTGSSKLRIVSVPCDSKRVAKTVADWRCQLREAKLDFSDADARSLAFAIQCMAAVNGKQSSPIEFSAWIELANPTFSTIAKEMKTT